MFDIWLSLHPFYFCSDTIYCSNLGKRAKFSHPSFLPLFLGTRDILIPA